MRPRHDSTIFKWTDGSFSGNAWAAAGIVRVLGTYASSSFSSSLQTEAADLVQWASEIQSGLASFVDSNSNLLHNYANDSATFSDAASSALFAASVYQLSRLLDAGVPNRNVKSTAGTHVGDLTKTVRGVVPTAERIRRELFASNSSGLEHFTGDMALTPVVNPHDIGKQLELPGAAAQGDAGNGTVTKEQVGANGGLDVSPEAQAFVLTMEAAYRDWANAGSPGQNGALPRGVSWVAVSLAVGIVVGALL